MLPGKSTLKRYPPLPARRPGTEAPFQSASGISTLGALRFELSWRYRELERQEQS